MSLIDKSIGTESKLVDSRDWERKEQGITV
jgi:hypothetical protein